MSFRVNLLQDASDLRVLSVAGQHLRSSGYDGQRTVEFVPGARRHLRDHRERPVTQNLGLHVLKPPVAVGQAI